MSRKPSTIDFDTLCERILETFREELDRLHSREQYAEMRRFYLGKHGVIVQMESMLWSHEIRPRSGAKGCSALKLDFEKLLDKRIEELCQEE